MNNQRCGSFEYPAPLIYLGLKLLDKLRYKNYQIAITLIIGGVVLALWKPFVLIEGLQVAGLYASIALPMALILGIVGIINLAHGDFMMFGAYFAYWFTVYTGADPLVAIFPVSLGLFLIGMATYRGTIKYMHGAPELIQLLLTFGISIVLQQLANLFWTSQPVSIHVGYASASATIGTFTFGTYGFVYVAAAVILFIGLFHFLRHTRIGQAALATGQNPTGAKLVGINIDRIYLLIFSISIALVGVMSVLFLTRHSIFPHVGGIFTLKSFCLAAMAGLGNLTGILWASLILGLGESFVKSFMGYAGWADIIFFVLIIVVIMVGSYRRRVK